MKSPGDTENPYQSPLQASEPLSNTSDDAPMQGRGLVGISLLLAVFIEILPLEVDLTVVALSTHNLPRFVVAKTICVAVILAPLLAYAWQNGWKGIGAQAGRVIAVCVILILRAAMDVSCVVTYLGRWPSPQP